MTKVLQIACLGPIKITFDEIPVVGLDSVKAQALLVYLTLNPQIHTRQAMANLLWGELPEADARRNLRGVVMKLRQTVGDNFFEVTHQTISFNREMPYWLDCEQFLRVNKANVNSLTTLAETAVLYRGEFMEQFYVRQAPEFEAWLTQKRHELQHQVIHFFDQLAEQYEQQQQYAAGVQAARRLLQLDPIREASLQKLMRTLALSGQRVVALREYEQFCQQLQEELGMEVSPETAVLAEQIKTGQLSTLSPQPSTPNLQSPTPNPQPPVPNSLPPVSTIQSPFIAGPPITNPAQFFGRERILRRIFNLLKQRPLQNAAIIGPRRSGKTSLLHYIKKITVTPPQQLRSGQVQNWLSNPEHYRWIFIDFQDPRMGTRDNLMRQLLTEMELNIPDSLTIESFLDVVSAGLSQPTIILFDEIGVAIERYPDLDDAFWESLRSLATNYVDGNLSFILASHASPDELAQHSGLGSPFFNIFGYSATLGQFKEEEARALIAHSPVSFSEEDIAWIVAESDCWPLLVQILSRERLLALEEGETGDEWQEDGRLQIAPFLSLKKEGN